jgi:hypothetical protein
MYWGCWFVMYEKSFMAPAKWIDGGNLLWGLLLWVAKVGEKAASPIVKRNAKNGRLPGAPAHKNRRKTGARHPKKQGSGEKRQILFG